MSPLAPNRPDASPRRRDLIMNLTGLGLALANPVLCILAGYAGPFPSVPLPILSNSSNYGWMTFFMFLVAFLHLVFAWTWAFLSFLIPSLRLRAGKVTLVLAVLPWFEWAAMFVFFALTVHS